MGKRANTELNKTSPGLWFYAASGIHVSVRAGKILLEPLQLILKYNISVLYVIIIDYPQENPLFNRDICCRLLV